MADSLNLDGFPYERRRLAASADIKNFVKKWLQVYDLGKGPLEDHAFGEELWSLGFVYDYERVSRLYHYYDETATLREIAGTTDILMIGDAIFCMWRELMRSDCMPYEGNFKNCFVALLNRLDFLAGV